MILSLIVAYASDINGKYVIGKDNKIPWHYPHDLERFREYTEGSAVIMGRNTHESIGRVLPNRDNLVLTTRQDYTTPGAYVFTTLKDALEFASTNHSEAFIIGGQKLYEQTINIADRLYITTFNIPGITGDAFFPKYDTSLFKCIHTEKKGELDRFIILDRKEATHQQSANYEDHPFVWDLQTLTGGGIIYYE